MTIARGDLDAAVLDGLVADIFRLERATSIFEAIGRRASDINDGVGHFGNLFGALQAALTTEAAMSVARIFDRPSKRYPTRSIRGVLDYLLEHIADLPTIREPYQLKLALQSMLAPQQLQLCADQTPCRFAGEFAAYIESLLDEPTRRESLARLRDLRDKELAHSEHVEKIDGPTWAAIADLTEIAKQVVGVLGWAYLSTAYMANGRYVLTKDAQRPSKSVDQLVEGLH